MTKALVPLVYKKFNSSIFWKTCHFRCKGLCKTEVPINWKLYTIDLYKETSSTNEWASWKWTVKHSSGYERVELIKQQYYNLYTVLRRSSLSKNISRAHA